MADNQVIIMGNLTRAPELRFTTSGKATCSFSVAQNRRYKQNDQWVDGPTNYFNVTVWDSMAENAAASLDKGDRVVCVGRIDFREYENKDGQTVRTHDVIVDEICPSLKWATAELARTQRGNGGGGQRSQAAAPPADDGQPYGRPADPVYSEEEPFVSLYLGHQSYRNMHMEPGF